MPHALRFLILLVLLFSQPATAQESSGNLLESAGKFLINLGKSGAEPAAPTVAENQDRNLRPQAAGSYEKRIALVIGNAAYTSSPLANPVNDARAISKQLRALGFEVIQRENLKTREIGAVYREFRSKIQPGATALFFYAGHGLQFKGQNYFPAVDSDISSEEEVPLQSLNLSQILDNMDEAKAGVSLVFLDACRDNPFARRFRSGLRGLAKVEAASGTLIHYATKPGSVAADGEGQNGTYTEALLAQMNEPGIPVELMLKKVSNRVVAKTKGKQEPWVEGSLRGDFYFIFQGPTTVTVQPQVDPEVDAWSAAQAVNSIAAYETYLESYPKGRFATSAKIKLTELKKGEKVQTSASPVPVATAATTIDPETAFWNEVKASNSPEYYDAYLKQYPKGKYLALARLALKKLDDAAKAEAARQEAERKQLAEQQKHDQLRVEREAWERAKSADSIAGYAAYLESYPKGQFSALAQAGKQKAERLAGEMEKQEAETRRKAQEQERLAAEMARLEAEKRAKEMHPGKVFRDCPDCPEMVVIPAGSFDMGGSYSDEQPVHRVTLKAFAIGKKEVTVGEFRIFTNSSGYLTTAEQDSNKGCFAWDAPDGRFVMPAERNWKNPGSAQNAHQPVTCVSWDDAQAYIRWFNRQYGGNYRLPSESEWEYAARAGSDSAQPWGKDQSKACSYANVADQTPLASGQKWNDKLECSDGHWFTAPVASFPPNNFGLHDMMGNVWEWTQDCISESYVDAPSDGSSITSGDCSRRILRGGSWSNYPTRVRYATRHGGKTAFPSNNNGFRLARTLSP